MEWRNARSDDLITLMSWINDNRQCLMWAGAKVDYPLQARRLSEQIEFSPANAWCLCEQDQLIGFGQLFRRAPMRVHLARLIVTPALRGHGYGTVLCRHLLDAARRWTDCEIATLNVYRSNLAAQALYARLGFQAVDLAASEERDPNVMLMIRALREPAQPPLAAAARRSRKPRLALD